MPCCNILHDTYGKSLNIVYHLSIHILAASNKYILALNGERECRHKTANRCNNDTARGKKQNPVLLDHYQ